jgi:hypothetical protein
MQYGKRIIVLKKLNINPVSDHFVSEEFDIKDVVDTMNGYSLIQEESKIDVKGNDVFLVLIFRKNNPPRQSILNVEDLIPKRQA